MMSTTPRDQFFGTQLKAVVGASADRTKYGNKVLRAYLQQEIPCVPINKKSKTIENIACVTSLTDLKNLLPQHSVRDISEVGVSIITPPGVTKLILEEGYNLGIRNFFLQPGTYDKLTDEFISSSLSQANVVKGCVLVELRFRDDDDITY